MIGNVGHGQHLAWAWGAVGGRKPRPFLEIGLNVGILAYSELGYYRLYGWPETLPKGKGGSDVWVLRRRIYWSC